MRAKLLQLCPTLVTTWTVALQAPLSVGILQARMLAWLPVPPPGCFPDPGIKPVSLMSPALAGGLFTTGTNWEAPKNSHITIITKILMIMC